MSKPDPKERITFYVNGSLKQQIETSADKAGQTLSIWIGRACEAHLAATTRPQVNAACSK